MDAGGFKNLDRALNGQQRNDTYRDSRLKRTQSYSKSSKILLEGGLGIIGAVALAIGGFLKLTSKQQ